MPAPAPSTVTGGVVVRVTAAGLGVRLRRIAMLLPVLGMVVAMLGGAHSRHPSGVLRRVRPGGGMMARIRTMSRLQAASP